MNRDIELHGRSWDFKLPIGQVLFADIFQDEESLQQELPFRGLKSLKKNPILLKNFISQSAIQRSFLSDCLVGQNRSSLRDWLKNFDRDPKFHLAVERSLKKIDAGKIQQFVRKSFVLVQAQRFNANIRKVCFFFSRIFQSPTGANVYFTPRGSQTYPRHSDPHDVFILQLQGQKKWKVYPKGRENQNKPMIQAVLRPGDLLMIPKGFEHEGSTTDQASLHVTFGLYKATRKELADFKKSNPYNVAKGPHHDRIWHFLFYLKTFQICQSDPVMFFFRGRVKDQLLALGHRKMFSLPVQGLKKFSGKIENNFLHSRFLLTNLN